MSENESDPRRFLWDAEDIETLGLKKEKIPPPPEQEAQTLKEKSADTGIRGPFGRSLGSPKGCVMANLSESDAARILEWQKTIKADDLAPDGLESELHITALYGLTNDDPAPVIEVCKKFGPLTATLGPIEAFQNDEYDVLKITVTSPDMEKLNEALKNLPHENDYPEYRPHLTLAYLKPGASKGYVGSDIFNGKELTFDSLVFSDAQKVKTQISLKPAPTSIVHVKAKRPVIKKK